MKLNIDVNWCTCLRHVKNTKTINFKILLKIVISLVFVVRVKTTWAKLTQVQTQKEVVRAKKATRSTCLFRSNHQLKTIYIILSNQHLHPLQKTCHLKWIQFDVCKCYWFQQAFDNNNNNCCLTYFKSVLSECVFKSLPIMWRVNAYRVENSLIRVFTRVLRCFVLGKSLLTSISSLQYHHYQQLS